MAFPGAEKLLDFAVPFDVPMLDQIIAAFYTPGADPTMVRARSLSPTRARTLPGDRFAGPSSRRPTTELLPRPDPEETRDAFAKPVVETCRSRLAVRDFSDRKLETPFLTLFSFFLLPFAALRG